MGWSRVQYFCEIPLGRTKVYVEGRELLGLLILFGPFRPARIRFMISSLGIFFWIVVLDGVLWEMVHVILLWMSNWRETIWAMKYSLLMAIRSG